MSSAPPTHQMPRVKKVVGGSVAVRGPQEPTSLGAEPQQKRPKGVRPQGPHGGKEEGEYLEGHGTPTPSEKVSRWHRDIYMMSPNGTVTTNHSAIAALAAATHGAIRGQGGAGPPPQGSAPVHAPHGHQVWSLSSSKVSCQALGKT